jgi:hypothetical protein
MLFVNTGYTNAMAGNVLLAFSLDPGQTQRTNATHKNETKAAPLGRLRAKATAMPRF